MRATAASPADGNIVVTAGCAVVVTAGRSAGRALKERSRDLSAGKPTRHPDATCVIALLSRERTSREGSHVEHATSFLSWLP